ncbi:valine--tRNA ligase [Candidatus Daviesbacteria bacterium]|nr:valine--tRNA ligase [Candidatus Daviesbacteria bacterium]
MDKIYNSSKARISSSAYNQKGPEEKWYKQSLKISSEEEIYRFWEENGFFKADPSSNKKPYSLLMPPPNVTGALHLGHAMQHSIMDAMARFKRMQGYDVLLLPGVDHAGIQFEGTLNKQLEKEGLSKQKLGRDAWLKRAWAFKEESYNSVSSTWRMMGLSADWAREVFTLDPKVEKAVLEEFKTFWEQDLLYKGAYIVQWCPKDQTAIEDLEMEYEERKEQFYYINYPLIEDPKKFITIATVRPETMFADVAVAVNPKDTRYKDLVGKKVLVPFVKREIPIIADELIDMQLGSGALKVDPAHSLVDYEIGKQNNLQIIPVIGKDGKLNENAGQFAGLKAQEVRKAIIEDLEKQGLLVKTEDTTHSVPVCERCKTTIEPLISEEWFVKMKPLADKALKRLHEVNFVPKNYQKVLTDWMKKIHDWCISRPLWWGYRIPVWYCQRCNPNHLVGKDKQSLRPNGLKYLIISVDHPAQSCQTCQLNEWVQDENLLDTWFSSGLWPMATLGWPTSAKATAGKPDQTEEFEKYFPWDFALTAPEIKYLWIARMIMLSLWFTDKIPFENMFFHGMLRDLQGRKFSKSLGNGIEPNDLRVQWGTDALRMALYSYSAPGRDGRASKQTMDERAKHFRNFSTKLRNISRFIVDLKPEGAKNWDGKLPPEPRHKNDEWILKKCEQTIKSVTRNIENFELHIASELIWEFIWLDLADNYIEKTKNRRDQAQPVLEYVFTTCLELLHPFMPFITEELWQKLPHQGLSIMVTKWPEAYEA